MTTDEVLSEFRAAGALLEGHFILSSGLRPPLCMKKNLCSAIRRAPSACAGRLRRKPRSGSTRCPPELAAIPTVKPGSRGL